MLGIGGIQVYIIELIATDDRTPKAAAGTVIGFTLTIGVLSVVT